MSLLVPDVGEAKLLKIALGVDANEDCVLKLFTNAITPAEGDTAASYTEPSGNGYAAITLTKTNWSVATAAGVTTGQQAAQTFTFTGGPVTCKGYFIVGATSGVLLWAEAFGVDFNITSAGGTIQVTPKVTLD